MFSRKYLLLDIMHMKSFGDILINLVLTFFGAILGYGKIVILGEENIFYCIWVVVLLDWGFGTTKAIFIEKNFETRKALKLVWYGSAYSCIAFTVLSIEDAHDSAFWLSEAIVFPLMFFQLLSALKNAALSGIIKQETMLKILSNIDKYKEQ
jgi:Bacteriophage holin family